MTASFARGIVFFATLVFSLHLSHHLFHAHFGSERHIGQEQHYNGYEQQEAHSTVNVKRKLEIFQQDGRYFLNGRLFFRPLSQRSHCQIFPLALTPLNACYDPIQLWFGYHEGI